MSSMHTSQIPGGFIVPNDTHIGMWQKQSGRLDHDTHLPVFVCSRLHPGHLVLDCGAFDGDHTIAYSRKVGSFGQVIAIEAGDLAFQCLQHNSQLFEHKNVITIKSILGQSSGFFGIHSEAPNLGASRCVGVASDEKNTIPTVSIDEISKTSGRKINFIKLDIEGWELLALKGAVSVLKTDRPEMLIEINRGALADAHATPEQITEFLGNHSYAWSIVQSGCRFSDPQFDIHCLPK